jgi:hypothetical protein
VPLGRTLADRVPSTTTTLANAPGTSCTPKGLPFRCHPTRRRQSLQRNHTQVVPRTEGKHHDNQSYVCIRTLFAYCSFRPRRMRKEPATLRRHNERTVANVCIATPQGARALSAGPTATSVTSRLIDGFKGTIRTYGRTGSSSPADLSDSGFGRVLYHQKQFGISCWESLERCDQLVPCVGGDCRFVLIDSNCSVLAES